VLETEIDILQVREAHSRRASGRWKEPTRVLPERAVKAIQKELGDGEEAADLEELEKRIKSAHMPRDARKKADAELKKLKLMSPMSAESHVVRNYMTRWSACHGKEEQDQQGSRRRVKILDADHYGLERSRNASRIPRGAAARRQAEGAVLCLVGPPGVGKTSLGQSIARATNRKFVRMSLGGVRDEARFAAIAARTSARCGKSCRA